MWNVKNSILYPVSYYCIPIKNRKKDKKNGGGGGGGGGVRLDRERGQFGHMTSESNKDGWRGRFPGIPLTIIESLAAFKDPKQANVRAVAENFSSIAETHAASFLQSATVKNEAATTASPVEPASRGSSLGASMMVVVVGILALPPGGGKSTMMRMLQEMEDATIVSSDECTVKKKNFDQQLRAAVKASATVLFQQNARGGGSATKRKYALVGYDKNIPQASGLAKLLKVLRPAAEDVAKLSGGAVELRLSFVVPESLSEQQCWARIKQRDESYLLNCIALKVRQM